MMWLKALHIISMVTWFAGLFYLPRLFVYHAMSEDQASIDRFKIMERKLYAGIMTPSMIATLLFGLWMLWDYAWAAYGNMGWLHVKLCLVGILVIYHLWCGRLLKTFKNDKNQRSHIWYRWFNEAPVIVLIAIVL
ncbi:MAG: protoporphyrinogen oxidase HemJ, partial [Candidatus Competibacteraceae bacterium]|nr:protoporphyrinogen oxidase HemJ [Candidatus Competibacteraceae bacterium]